MPHALFDTAFGTCGIAWNDVGITGVHLPEASREATLARARKRDTASDEVQERAAPGWVKDAVKRIRQHLAGKPQDLSLIPLDLRTTPAFVAKVFRACAAIPAGKTTTYGELARAAGGAVGSARAVGQAMAKNPFPLLVPCHRVVGAQGSTGGFSAYGGVVTKERLLVAEGGSLTPQRSLFDGTSNTLPFDPEVALRHLTKNDAVLGRHIARVGPLRLQLKETEGTFSALAESIVYQQLTGKAAGTIFGRVRALYPGGRLDPKRLLATRDEDLRAAGLSGSKTKSLRDLAERTLAGEIPPLSELGRLEDDAIIDRLTHVRGIGRWTVEMLLIFRLGRPDVLPVADYGVRKGFAQVFGRGRKNKDELPNAAEMNARGDRWRPYRSVASWYLWRAND